MTHPPQARHRIGLVAAALIATLLPALPHSAMAQQIGNPGAGLHLAQTWCSNCHVVERVPQHLIALSGPTFTAVARMPSTTPMALSVFLQTPHGRMPDLHLSRDEIEDLSAYILSLRHK